MGNISSTATEAFNTEEIFEYLVDTSQKHFEKERKRIQEELSDESEKSMTLRSTSARIKEKFEVICDEILKNPSTVKDAINFLEDSDRESQVIGAEIRKILSFCFHVSTKIKLSFRYRSKNYNIELHHKKDCKVLVNVASEVVNHQCILQCCKFLRLILQFTPLIYPDSKNTWKNLEPSLVLFNREKDRWCNIVDGKIEYFAYMNGLLKFFNHGNRIKSLEILMHRESSRAIIDDSRKSLRETFCADNLRYVCDRFIVSTKQMMTRNIVVVMHMEFVKGRTTGIRREAINTLEHLFSEDREMKNSETMKIAVQVTLLGILKQSLTVIREGLPIREFLKDDVIKAYKYIINVTMTKLYKKIVGLKLPRQAQMDAFNLLFGIFQTNVLMGAILALNDPSLIKVLRFAQKGWDTASGLLLFSNTTADVMTALKKDLDESYGAFLRGWMYEKPIPRTHGSLFNEIYDFYADIGLEMKPSHDNSSISKVIYYEISAVLPSTSSEVISEVDSLKPNLYGAVGSDRSGRERTRRVSHSDDDDEPLNLNIDLPDEFKEVQDDGIGESNDTNVTNNISLKIISDVLEDDNFIDQDVFKSKTDNRKSDSVPSCIQSMKAEEVPGYAIAVEELSSDKDSNEVAENKIELEIAQDIPKDLAVTTQPIEENNFVENILPDYIQAAHNNTAVIQSDFPEAPSDIPEAQSNIPVAQSDVLVAQSDVPVTQSEIPESKVIPLKKNSRQRSETLPQNFGSQNGSFRGRYRKDRKEWHRGNNRNFVSERTNSNLEQHFYGPENINIRYNYRSRSSSYPGTNMAPKISMQQMNYIPHAHQQIPPLQDVTRLVRFPPPPVNQSDAIPFHPNYQQGFPVNNNPVQPMIAMTNEGVPVLVPPPGPGVMLHMQDQMPLQLVTVQNHPIDQQIVPNHQYNPNMQMIPDPTIAQQHFNQNNPFMAQQYANELIQAQPYTNDLVQAQSYANEMAQQCENNLYFANQYGSELAHAQQYVNNIGQVQQMYGSDQQGALARHEEQAARFLNENQHQNYSAFNIQNVQQINIHLPEGQQEPHYGNNYPVVDNNKPPIDEPLHLNIPVQNTRINYLPSISDPPIIQGNQPLLQMLPNYKRTSTEGLAEDDILEQRIGFNIDDEIMQPRLFADHDSSDLSIPNVNIPVPEYLTYDENANQRQSDGANRNKPEQDTYLANTVAEMVLCDEEADVVGQNQNLDLPIEPNEVERAYLETASHYKKQDCGERKNPFGLRTQIRPEEMGNGSNFQPSTEFQSADNYRIQMYGGSVNQNFGFNCPQNPNYEMTDEASSSHFMYDSSTGVRLKERNNYNNNRFEHPMEPYNVQMYSGGNSSTTEDQSSLIQNREQKRQSPQKDCIVRSPDKNKHMKSQNIQRAPKENKPQHHRSFSLQQNSRKPKETGASSVEYPGPQVGYHKNEPSNKNIFVKSPNKNKNFQKNQQQRSTNSSNQTYRSFALQQRLRQEKKESARVQEVQDAKSPTKSSPQKNQRSENNRNRFAVSNTGRNQCHRSFALQQSILRNKNRNQNAPNHPAGNNSRMQQHIENEPRIRILNRNQPSNEPRNK